PGGRRGRGALLLAPLHRDRSVPLPGGDPRRAHAPLRDNAQQRQRRRRDGPDVHPRGRKTMTAITGLLDGQFTLGIEEEFQIVHVETRELRSYVSQLLEEGKQHALLRERVRPEMHQSVVETGTGICRDIKQARAEISELRGTLNSLAKKDSLRIVAAGTHPFSDWKKQEITDGERYKVIVEDLQDVPR